MSLFRAFRALPLLARPDARLQDDALRVDTRLGEVAIAIRRNAQARRMTLRVRSAARDVTLTLPARTSLAAARDFVERHVGWIEQRLARLPEHVPFAHGEIIPLRGEPHRIVLKESVRGLVRVEPGLRGDTPILAVYGLAPHAARRLGDFLKREARDDLTEAVRRHAAALGVMVGRMTIKDTKSRWGSCSVAGDLAFSWRLILAPPYVLDYLAAHEVAHRKEMNHGPRYWAHVARIVPDYDRAEAWLKAHGATLHRYG
ncbi:putative metal-dependent hydrolase [Methylopila capsulata]|uniref:Metal-dependent hydrolase n=1 Tax=Methylopila capsulata TaxID=61654 RepID=A0A9W6IR43_9HYPH|nr:SprT family zinc-dependent metalloprotease [Methylopila capsulata]MBM7851881.1 putative metal-dependent hydrolase [Methylopila capsulata]GLK54946.1 metal-dependent hydrolase [Methylopila capsulata]